MGFRYARKRKQGIAYMQRGIQKKWACRKITAKKCGEDRRKWGGHKKNERTDGKKMQSGGVQVKKDATKTAKYKNDRAG